MNIYDVCKCIYHPFFLGMLELPHRIPGWIV
jgi:hypothetical protein